MKKRSPFPPEPADGSPTEETPPVPSAPVPSAPVPSPSSPSPPASLDPDAVAAQRFGVTRKGYDPASVHEFLGRIAAEIRRVDAAAEASRLEAAHLRRQLDDFKASGRPPDRVEALAVLGDETNRVLSAAQDSAAEIISAAENAAGEIKARAREEAEQLSAEVREYAESAARRTSEQAAEVRERLREEVRRARREVAEGAARINADAKAHADEARAVAREESARLRAEAEDVASTHRRDVEERVKMRLMEAEREAEEILGAARIRIGRLEEEAKAARVRLLQDVQRRRVSAEAHVRALEDARARLAGELAGGRTLLAGLLGELESVRLDPVELPSLEELPGVLDLAAAEAGFDADDAAEEVAAEADEGADAVQDEEAADAPDAADVIEAEIVPEPEDLGPELLGEEEAEPALAARTGARDEVEVAGEGAEEAPPPDAMEDDVRSAAVEAEGWGELDDVPDDTEVDDLFARVMAGRGSDDGTGVPPAAEPAPEVGAGEVPDEAPSAGEAEWGYLEDGSPVEEAAVAGAGEGSAGEERRRRLRRAFSLLEASSSNEDLAVRSEGPTSTVGSGEEDAPGELAAGVPVEVPPTGEIPAEVTEPVAEPSTVADGGPDGTTQGEPDELAAVVAVVSRRLKRALQDDENVLLDATREGEAPMPSDDDGRLELLVEYLEEAVTDAVTLGAGDADAAVDTATVIEGVCRPWVARLGAELDGLSHADAVSAAYRIFRAEASDFAADLVRAAYEAGRRAAASASGSVTGA